MGINKELITIVLDLLSASDIPRRSVVELGAQDVCVLPDIIDRTLRAACANVLTHPIVSAKDLYRSLGFDHYACIDASGGHEALTLDLNKNLRDDLDYTLEFDLVTNLGTSEHCFDQAAVFRNVHQLCSVGGSMIHAVPVQGNVNHGFYSYHPRFFAELAAANNYQVIQMAFTVDYDSVLVPYSLSEFQRWDSHDLLFYAVFRKRRDDSFAIPFDGMFTQANRLTEYSGHMAKIDPMLTDFTPYLKSGDWANTQGNQLFESQPRTALVLDNLKRLFNLGG